MQMADKFSSMLRRVHFLEEAELKEMAKVDRESARVRSMLQSDAVNELREVDLMAAADVASENMNLALRNEFSTLTPLQLRCRYEGRRQSASIVIAEGKGNYQPAQRSLRNPLCCNTPILLQADDVSLLLGRSRTKLGVELRRCAPVGLKASPLRPSAREQVGKLSCTSQDHPLTADMISHLGPLSSLKSLEVCVEGLTRVCVLQQAPALTSLSLNVNCICSLEGLASCKNLRELSLSDNCLASLVGLGELEKLQELRVDVNSLTSLDGLESMPSLTELSAGTNRIASLPKGLALPRLQKLSLYHNRISSLPVPALSHMRQLMQLDLGRNNLREIHGSALSACPSLVRLVLSQNRLHTVPAPLCLPLLRELWLSGNSLTSLAEWNNEGLLFVPSLISLHVDDNQLAFLGGSMTLVGAPLLRDLNLSFNSLEDTNEGVESALVPCTRLRHLQLHDNPLAEAHCYPQKVIGGCPGLWTLDGESIRPADMHSAALSISGGSSHIVMPWLLALRSSGLPAVSRRGTSSPFCWTSARRWAWARHGSARLRHRGSSLAAGELRDLSCGYEVTCAGGGVGLALLQGQQRREEASLNVRREEVPDGQADLKLQHASERVALVQQLFRQMYGYDNVALPPVTSRLVYHESLKEKACQKIKIWFRDAMARKKDAMLPQGTSTAVISLQSAFRGFHVRKALRAALESARYIDEELEGMALEDPFDVEAFLGASPAQLSAGWDCEAPQLRRPEPAAPAWGATPQSQGKHATHACKGSSESHAPPPASAAESQLVDDWGLSDPRVLLARRRRLRKLERNVELRAKRADPYYRLRKFERNAGMR
jgi:Leucine-rich repeat (LRR) protein